jgi:hypothetical protein
MQKHSKQQGLRILAQLPYRRLQNVHFFLRCWISCCGLRDLRQAFGASRTHFTQQRVIALKKAVVFVTAHPANRIIGTKASLCALWQVKNILVGW